MPRMQPFDGPLESNRSSRRHLGHVWVALRYSCHRAIPMGQGKGSLCVMGIWRLFIFAPVVKGTGEEAHSIVFAGAVVLFFLFSAQKTHVKPPNQLKPYHPTTSAWHFSYAQPAILDI